MLKNEDQIRILTTLTEEFQDKGNLHGIGYGEKEPEGEWKLRIEFMPNADQPESIVSDLEARLQELSGDSEAYVEVSPPHEAL